eukprot:TRINITY_DN40315_c0_g1_i1.p1 TRINITY_DN40315_c0_g1~~TRINITY_DN40315_c0_g1_i1.p1  ORF type:complete len:436 (+),score=138.05 TRINITY_DN40315_c0_g1_i1:63-1310(+)
MPQRSATDGQLAAARRQPETRPRSSTDIRACAAQAAAPEPVLAPASRRSSARTATSAGSMNQAAATALETVFRRRDAGGTGSLPSAAALSLHRDVARAAGSVSGVPVRSMLSTPVGGRVSMYEFVTHVQDSVVSPLLQDAACSLSDLVEAILDVPGASLDTDSGAESDVDDGSAGGAEMPLPLIVEPDPADRIRELESERAELRDEVAALVQQRRDADVREATLRSELERSVSEAAQALHQVPAASQKDARLQELEQRIAHLEADRSPRVAEQPTVVVSPASSADFAALERQVDELRAALRASEAARVVAERERDAAQAAMLAGSTHARKRDQKLHKAEEVLAAIVDACLPQAIRAASPPALGADREPTAAAARVASDHLRAEALRLAETQPRDCYRLPSPARRRVSSSPWLPGT